VLPADTPPDFGYVTDRAQQEAQANLAALVPGAKHVMNTDSGHEIHKDQPQLSSTLSATLSMPCAPVSQAWSRNGLHSTTL